MPRLSHGAYDQAQLDKVYLLPRAEGQTACQRRYISCLRDFSGWLVGWLTFQDVRRSPTFPDVPGGKSAPTQSPQVRGVLWCSGSGACEICICLANHSKDTIKHTLVHTHTHVYVLYIYIYIYTHIYIDTVYIIK